MNIKGYIEERSIEIAKYTIKNKSVVRETARKFGVCKSTVFRDLTFILPKVDLDLAQKVADVLSENFSDKHNRGGRATKDRYKGPTQQI